MSDLRVATIIHGYFPRVGGAETQLRALVPHLKERGIEMSILTRRYDATLPSHEIIDGISVYRLPASGPKVWASLRFTFAAFWRLLRLRPQLVHAHEFISPATVGLLAERFLGIPLIVTSHRSGEIGDVQKMQRKRTGPYRLKALKERASSFVVISDEIWDELRNIGVDAERLARITNGVDTHRFSALSPDEKATARVETGFDPAAPTAIFTGRLVPEKRLDLLIRVWAQFRKTFPNAVLMILGAGAEEERLKAMAGEGVRFMGSTTDVVPYLQLADIFVLPSVAEGLSVALLEAMSCELVPLLTDVGGAREVVTHQQDGWVIAPDDEAALLDGLQQLFGDGQTLNKRSQAARKRVIEKFSVQLAAEKLSKLYFDLYSRQSS